MYTSLADVYAQILVWFSPISILVAFSLLFYSIAQNRKRGLHLAMLLWILMIAIALFAVQRDIRYFVDIATFPVLFLTAEVVDINRKQLAKALEVLVIVFAVVFMTLGMVVGYQLNGGFAEAGQFVNQNFHNPSVAVNGYSDTYFVFLSHGDNITNLPGNETALSASLSSNHYDVVLVWQQSRSLFISNQYATILESHFSHHVQLGPSDFSYVTVYYNNLSS